MAESKPAMRKPDFTKVNQLRPGTSGHTLTVKVVSSKTVLQKGRAAGSQVRQMRLAECLVGDETGMIVFTARNEQAVGGLQVQTRSQAVGAAHEEHNSEQDEREVGYSLRAKQAQSGALTEKRSHNERLTMVETRLDVLEASFEELYQGQRRLLGVESSQEEVESRIDKIESHVNRLTEDTKDSVHHLH
ncbi:hypothetical protein GW17_00033901, partial [Ensete ventricosum]